MSESWHSDRIEKPASYWKDERLDPQPTFRSRKCLEVSGNERREIDADVAVEVNLSIMVNGSCMTALAALPDHLKELAVGFLVCEGVVGSFQEITSVQVDGNALICETRDQKALPWKGHQCCSVGGNSTEGLKPVVSDLKIKADDLLRAVDGLNQKALLWRRTGATHMSIICNARGENLASCEDVSRSSSVDKTVGQALLSGADLSRCALITSGRLSGVMVAKAARAGFPVLVSKSAAMNSGVELAEKIGMTLVAFARSPNLYIYTEVGRVL
ncbi:MAG TPA: formate dehydrogenase accessory sulfurtransferase FdhD [Methanotrichaceae archaeon]|nr:formate dehydrogenase accessory sulfurtransferase FdhD [Methanotrichaceae archaeon]